MIQSDPTDLEMFIRCDPSIPYWCAEFHIYEVDTILSQLLVTKCFCSHERERSFMYTNFTLGGDHSPHYEFNYMIDHTCTSSGSVRCLYDSNNEISVSVTGHRYVALQQALFNRGENKECEFDYMKVGDYKRCRHD